MLFGAPAFAGAVFALCVVLRVRCPGPPGSCSPACTPCLWCCVYGVLGLLAPVHRCARSVCGVVRTVSWASWLPFTGVHALCVVLRVRCPGPLGSRSPVCLFVSAASNPTSGRGRVVAALSKYNIIFFLKRVRRVTAMSRKAISLSGFFVLLLCATCSLVISQLLGSACPGRMHKVAMFVQQRQNHRRRTRHATEKRMRDVIEHMFGVEFDKTRPDWLRNPVANRCLELDMYNAEMKLAFKYDGAQHRHYTPHYHGNSVAHFHYRKMVDNLKDDMCAEHGVRLIRIPYNVAINDLPTYLRGCATGSVRLREILQSIE